MTYSIDNTIRCYEIKVDFSELNNKKRQTFICDYNYLVISQELWEKLAQDDELMWKYKNWGIYVFSEKHMSLKCVKKSKKQNVLLGNRITALESMVRSLNQKVDYFHEKEKNEIGSVDN